MGLDGVELAIRVEKEFDIQIEDADYEHLKTVGDLERYVTWKLGRSAHSGWSAYQEALVWSFCQMRREITRRTGIARRELRPSTRLREHWDTAGEWSAMSNALSMELGVPIPIWRVEGWMIGGCLGLLLSPLMAIGCLALDVSPLWAVGLVCMLWGASAVEAVQRSRSQFNAACLADVTRESCFLLSQRRAVESGQPASVCADDDILARLIAIVGEVGSIPPNEIRRESRFVEDLKFG